MPDITALPIPTVLATKDLLGLGAVDNTADAAKPVSAAQAAADAAVLAQAIVRSNHTGTQTSATISDFNEAAQDAAATLFANGTHSGITFTYNDAGNAINATASGGGGGGQSSILFQSEGISLGTSGTVDTLDMKGPGARAARIGNKIEINTQRLAVAVTTSRALTASDDNKVLVVDSASTVVLTVPLALPDNWTVLIQRVNLGMVDVQGVGGVNFDTTHNLLMTMRGAEMTLRKRGATENFSVVNTSFALVQAGLQPTTRKMRWLHEFGNVGNAAADHTAIIQAWQDACEAEGAMAMVGPGAYNFNADIFLKASTVGAGGGYVRGSIEVSEGVPRDNAATIFRRQSTLGDNARIRINSLSNFHISGFRTETPTNPYLNPQTSGSDVSLGQEITVFNCSNYLISDVVTYRSRAGAILQDRCMDGMLYRCMGERNCKDDFHITTGKNIGEVRNFGRLWRKECVSIASMDDGFPVVGYSDADTPATLSDIYDIDCVSLGQRKARSFLYSGATRIRNSGCFSDAATLPTYSATDRLGATYERARALLAYVIDPAYEVKSVVDAVSENFTGRNGAAVAGYGNVWIKHSGDAAYELNRITITGLDIADCAGVGVHIDATVAKRVGNVSIQGRIDNCASRGVLVEGGRDVTTDLVISNCGRSALTVNNTATGLQDHKIVSIDNLQTTSDDLFAFGETTGTASFSELRLDLSFPSQVPPTNVDRAIEVASSVPTGVITRFVVNGVQHDTSDNVLTSNSTGLSGGGYSETASNERRIIGFPFMFPPPAVVPVRPAGALTLSASSVGTARTFSGAPAGTFLPTDVGQVINERDGAGVGIITGWNSDVSVAVTITVAFSSTTLASGAWALKRWVRRYSAFGTLTLNATTGVGVNATCSVRAFVTGDVGKMIRQHQGDGLARITSVTTDFVAVVTVITAWSGTTAIEPWSWWIEDFDASVEAIPAPASTRFWRTARVFCDGITGVRVGPHPDFPATNRAWRDVTLEGEQRTLFCTASVADITCVGHGRNPGDAILLNGTAAPTGFTLGQTYWVISTSLTVDTLRLAATKGGAAITPGTTGTAVTMRFRRLSGFWKLAPGEAFIADGGAVTGFSFTPYISLMGPR